MKRWWGLLALMLAACQSQPAAGHTAASPAAAVSDLVYVQDPSGPRMLEMEWSGRVVGSVSAAGFSSPSPDGSRFLRTSLKVSAESWRGQQLGSLELDPSASGLATWADDGRHLCGIVFPANSGPDQGGGSVWVGAPGEKARIIGAAGRAGSDPAVASCSFKNDRVIVAGGLMPHWPAGGTRYLITTDIQVMRLSSGAVEYEHQYPAGNLGGQLESGAPGDWRLVVASPDARYVAEAGVFNNTTTIREAGTGKKLAELPGDVLGFSSDGSRVVTTSNSSGAWQTQLVTWTDGHPLWQTSGTGQSMLARPGSADVLIGIVNGSQGLGDVVLVPADGKGRVLLRNGLVTWPCPCPAGF